MVTVDADADAEDTDTEDAMCGVGTEEYR